VKSHQILKHCNYLEYDFESQKIKQESKVKNNFPWMDIWEIL
jgi:hypothetical protein